MAAQASEPRYCACGTRLARDNKGKRCTACQKAASRQRVAPPAVPASFWRSPELVAALDAWHIGQVIRAYRLHEYWPEPIVQAVVANWFGLTQAQLSRIENGAPVTDLAKLIPIVQTLGVPANLLWFKLPKDKADPALPSGQTNDHANTHVKELAAADATTVEHFSSTVPKADEEDDKDRRCTHGELTSSRNSRPFQGHQA